MALAADDAVILAVPPYVASSLVRDLEVPTEFRAIVNAHFRIAPPAAAADPRRAQRHGAMDVRLSGPGLGHHQRRRSADRRAARRAGEKDLERGRSRDRPAGGTCRPGRSCASAARPSRRRPAQDAKRPGAATQWRNLVLAGDWTDTGLPATIEGAIRSGNRAADIIARGCSVMDDSALDPASIDERDATALLARQRPDGHWVFELEADATIPAEYVLLRHYLGEPVDAALEAKIAVYLRRIQGAHGGWPLFPDGDLDISATVKAYFALKMIGDSIDADHMRRAREAVLRPRRRRARQRVHPHHAGAVRLHSVARGAGDAGRDHAAAEMVSVPPRQDLLLEPHRHRAAAGADGEEAAGAQRQGRAHRRAVPRAAAEHRPDAEGAAAESVVVLVLPRRRQCAARDRAVFSESARASARSIARSPG